jgi:hypothetical protein
VSELLHTNNKIPRPQRHEVCWFAYKHDRQQQYRVPNAAMDSRQGWQG